ncbi:hypothetical protein ACX80R_08380, partial [Paeniglutamicibacter antarcticus]
LLFGTVELKSGNYACSYCMAMSDIGCGYPHAALDTLTQECAHGLSPTVVGVQVKQKPPNQRRGILS